MKFYISVFPLIIHITNYTYMYWLSFCNVFEVKNPYRYYSNHSRNFEKEHVFFNNYKTSPACLNLLLFPEDPFMLFLLHNLSYCLILSPYSVSHLYVKSPTNHQGLIKLRKDFLLPEIGWEPYRSVILCWTWTVCHFCPF